MDRVELRRLNLVAASEMPYKTPLVYKIDCGDFGAVLSRALELADWDGVDRRKKKAAKSGKLRGIGIAVHMENAGLANETAEIRIWQSSSFDPSKCRASDPPWRNPHRCPCRTRRGG